MFGQRFYVCLVLSAYLLNVSLEYTEQHLSTYCSPPPTRNIVIFRINPTVLVRLQCRFYVLQRLSNRIHNNLQQFTQIDYDYDRCDFRWGEYFPYIAYGLNVRT